MQDGQEGPNVLPGDTAVSERHLRPLLDLDPTAPSIDGRSAYSWRGRVWQKEDVGCVLCVENGSISTLSSTNDDGTEVFHCMEHGDLAQVQYQMVKKYTVAIGDVVREGEETVLDSMLFPASMTADERTALIDKLLDEVAEEERDANTV